MNANIKTRIELGAKAFETYIDNGEEGLILLANVEETTVKTLKSEMRKYINRVIPPKPTEEKLAKYYKVKNETINPEILKEQEAFYAFLKTITEPSAIVNLAIKQKCDLEEIRHKAFNYKKRIENPKPTNEEINTFNAINLTRKESYQKERIDFSFIEKLISLDSTKVKDYLEMVIEGELNVLSVITKIDYYIKYNHEEEANVKKVSLIKKHLIKYTDYINTERRARSTKKLAIIEEENNREKVMEILEQHLIDKSLNINTLIKQNKVSEKTFNKFLDLFKDGSPTEKLLASEYQNNLIEEKHKITEIVKLINHYLTNGIEKKGLQSKFTILDYCRLTKMKPDAFLSKAWGIVNSGDITRAEIKRIINFFNMTSSNNRLYTEEELLTYDFSYNNQTIDDQNIKMKIINYLKILEIPLYLNYYYCAQEEYLKGELELNNYTFE